MFIKYKDYNLPIENVELINEFTLHLKTSLYTYQYIACGDCCSTSIIQTYNDIPFSFLIGKIIKGVKEIHDFEYNSDDTDDRYVETPHLYQISFKNSNEIFEFIMINYSNGYYDGWLRSNVII